MDNRNPSKTILQAKEEGIYEYVNENVQLCPSCKSPISIMPGSRDAVCQNCGYKDPCCE